MTTVDVGGYRVTFRNLAGWTEKGTGERAGAAFQTDQHKSGVVIHVVSPGTHETLIRDMRAASAIMPWQQVVNTAFVDLGPNRAFRVFTVLHGVILQAHYYFERPAPEGGALLAFVFTFAHGEEKQVDRFDGFFDGLTVA